MNVAAFDRLAEEISARTGESKTMAVRTALEERMMRLGLPSEIERQREWDAIKSEIYAKLPPEAFTPWTRDDYDRLFED